MSRRDRLEKHRHAERTLQDYTNVILRRVRVVALILVTALAITTGYVFTRTPLYTSVASIEIEEKGSRSKDKDSIYGNPEYDQFKGYISTQIEILKSRDLAEEMVTRMSLLDDPEFASAGSGWIGTRTRAWFVWDEDSIDTDYQQAARLDRAVKCVMDRVKVKTVKASNLLQISMDAASPQMAVKLLQNYIGIYLENNLEKRRTESLQAAAWLQEELKSVQEQLRVAQVSLLDFVIDHGIVDTQEGGQAQVIKMLNKRMEGHIKSEEARAKVQAMEDQNVSDESILFPKDIANNEYIGKLKQELAMMESEYTQMRGLYSPNYPKLRMLEKKIQFLTERIAATERSLISSALSSAKKEEKILAGSYESGKREVARVRSLEAEYTTLKKGVETNTEFQKILLKEYKQMDIRARTITNDIKTVDRPSTPVSSSWPRKRLFLLIGALIGLTVGIAGAFAVERLDDTLQNPREIDVDLSVKRLGIVPDMAKLPSSYHLIERGAPYEFVAFTAPKSPLSDAIRNIQASIFLANPGLATKCLAFSSATPSEGKTLIAVSMATVLTSGRNKRVVIVDADLRRPRLHKVFGKQEPGHGLASILNVNNQDFRGLIRTQSKVPGLSYVTSGPVPDDPALILQSDRAREFFTYLKESFDYVIIDCPPILGMADTPTICLQADGLIMVARQGHVGRDELKEAMKGITSAKACPILGVVMNMAHAPGATKYLYRYSRQFYDYGYYHRDYSQVSTGGR